MDDQPTGDGAPLVVTLPAAFDATNADQVFDLLCAAVASGAPVVIADLSATTLCDTAGVHRLLMIRSQLAARGGHLRLVVPPGALTRRMLVLLGADHLLPVYSSVGGACRPPAGPHDPLAT